MATAVAIHYESVESWLEEGERRFGSDRSQWRFVCPVCGYVARVAQWEELGVPEAAAFSCAGRWMPGPVRDVFMSPAPGPCNYAGGGLFKLNPVAIDGLDERFFAFADPDERDD